MPRNCLRINHEGDSIQLSWQRGQFLPRPAPSVTFTHPFDEQALADLRWYLEEYLRFPYGIFPDNAAKIEQKFQDWGEQLFDLVFRSSEQARQFFQAATYDGLNQCELVITSDSPEVLNLPWELLYSPSDRQFLAPSLAGMSRSLSEYAVRAEMGDLPQDKLNILLVIARPYGEKDIALRTIARPLLEAISNIRQKVNLKVLRPPSFEQFERELNAHRGFYHIVHFDGHGDFDANSMGFQHQLGGSPPLAPPYKGGGQEGSSAPPLSRMQEENLAPPLLRMEEENLAPPLLRGAGGVSGQGVLVFEAADGSPDIVTAAKIAQNLADCRVPIFVLNACKSAQEGEEKFSSVATRLVSLGAKGVVAMAYSVYAQAAKHFMGRLYGELAAGATLDSAVAAGRKDVLNKPLRPSPKGDKPLQDWLVPVLYQQESYQPFSKVGSAHPTNEIPDIEDFLEPTVSNLVGFPEEGAYGFIGRDYDILRLERAFRQNNIVLLQGMAGVGKTELACGFARWLDQTQGRTGKMFFMSFEHGATLSNVVNQLGRDVWGDKFSQYPAEQQQQAVLNYLKTQPSLLIWDNFEPVAGFPAGNEPLLNASERDNLQRFLKDLRGGKSWVLITSRREERWLDCGYSLVELRGLREQDVEELAAKILQTAGVDRAKLSSEYLDLLKLLGGHPFSLRVVLPHLKTQSPVQVIEALRLGLDNLENKTEEGRDKSLTASLDYSFSRLSERARKHLPFLALFSERVGADILHAFSGSPTQMAYQAVFGENLQETDWLKLLNEAAAAGILEHLDETIYKIHPALPWYLRQQLSKKYTAEEVSVLEKKLLFFYAVLAENCRKELIGNAELAGIVLRFEEPNLLQNLRLAEQQQSWKEAEAILQALGDVYKRIGRKTEFKALRQRALKEIASDLLDAKEKGQDVFGFWIHLRIEDANDALGAADLEGARTIYQEILDELTSLNDPLVNDKVAVLYHNLGMVAQQQRRFDEATSFYNKALKIREDVEDLHNAATDYQNLGIVAQQQLRFKDATAFYHKALTIYEDAGDFYNAANVYHHFGVVAQEQRCFDEAAAFYHKALQIYEGAGDFYNAADEYHQLGVVAQEQRRFDEATSFYNKALKIREDAGDFYKAAGQYHNLGAVAQEQRCFDEATAFYHKALKIYEGARDFYKAASDYHQLGRVAQEQRRFEEAINYYQKAFEIRQQFQDWRKASLTLSRWANVLET